MLEKAGIDVKIDLPGVGANVQEHLYSGLVYGEYFADIIVVIIAHLRLLHRDRATCRRWA